MPWAAAAAAVASVAGSVITSNAQSKAVKSGQDNANRIADATKATAQPLYQPFIDQGTAGLGAYADITGVNGPDAATKAMGNFTASPGYQYQLDQGLRAVDAGAASKGLLRSGATIKAEQTLGSNLASQDFGNYVSRLNTLANFGTTGVNGFTNVLTGQANNQQSTDTSAAGQQASIAGNEGKGISNAIGGAFFGNSSVQNGLSSLFSSGGNGTLAASQNPNAGSGGFNAGGFT